MIAQVPMLDNRKTGYKWLNKTETGALHPGEDLNAGSYGSADYGLPVKAMSDGVVVFSKDAGEGWGRVVVLWHEKLKVWSRYAHFSEVYATKGEHVNMGQVIGRCGNSGTGSSHLHWEVIKKKLPTWTTYPNSWSKSKVLEYWESPYPFIGRVNKDFTGPSEFAKEAIDAAIKKMVATKWDDPKQIVGDAVAEQMFINMGVLNKKLGNLSKERLAVAIHRAGWLD